MARHRHVRSTLVGMAAVVAAAQAQAAAVYLSPGSSSVALADGTVTLDLVMDFRDVTTIGGSLDFTFAGSLAFRSFAPSDYLRALDPAPDDTDFTGYGTTRADGDFEIHAGAWDGLTGLHVLGQFTADLVAAGPGQVHVGFNSLFGPFYPTTFNGGGTVVCALDVVLTGAVVDVRATADGTPPTAAAPVVTTPPECWDLVAGRPPPTDQPPDDPQHWTGGPGWPPYPDMLPDTVPEGTQLPLPATAWLLGTSFALAAAWRSGRRA